jgi:hypothetical protein
VVTQYVTAPVTEVDSSGRTVVRQSEGVDVVTITVAAGGSGVGMARESIRARFRSL